MKSEKLQVVRGSGNAFRDLGHKSADAEQFKAILAAEIIKALERERRPCAQRILAPVSQRPTSPVSAMLTLDASRWTA
jgi:hypothetical protein